MPAGSGVTADSEQSDLLDHYAASIFSRLARARRAPAR